MCSYLVLRNRWPQVVLVMLEISVGAFISNISHPSGQSLSGVTVEGRSHYQSVGLHVHTNVPNAITTAA